MLSAGNVAPSKKPSRKHKMQIVKNTNTNATTTTTRGPGRPPGAKSTWNPATATLFSVPAALLIQPGSGIPMLRNLTKEMPIPRTDTDKKEAINQRIQAGEPLSNEFLMELVSPVGYEKISLADMAERHPEAMVEIGTAEVKNFLLAMHLAVMAKIGQLDPRTAAAEAAAAAAAAEAAAEEKELKEESEETATAPAPDAEGEEEEEDADLS